LEEIAMLGESEVEVIGGMWEDGEVGVEVAPVEVGDGIEEEVGGATALEGVTGGGGSGMEDGKVEVGGVDVFSSEEGDLVETWFSGGIGSG
jgi:hypothetical protein